MKTLSTSEIYAKNPFSYDALEGDSLLLGWRRGGADSSNMGFAIDTVEAEGVEPCPVELGREGHVVTIAPTGSGKGRGCIIPTLLTSEFEAVRNFAEIMVEEAAAHGRTLSLGLASVAIRTPYVV